MTRKDYVKFAAMLKAMRADTATYLAEEMVNVVCANTADIFAEDNPRFDHDRFFTACGVKS